MGGIVFLRPSCGIRALQHCFRRGLHPHARCLPPDLQGRHAMRAAPRPHHFGVAPDGEDLCQLVLRGLPVLFRDRLLLHPLRRQHCGLRRSDLPVPASLGARRCGDGRAPAGRRRRVRGVQHPASLAGSQARHPQASLRRLVILSVPGLRQADASAGARRARGLGHWPAQRRAAPPAEADGDLLGCFGVLPPALVSAQAAGRRARDRGRADRVVDRFRVHRAGQQRAPAEEAPRDVIGADEVARARPEVLGRHRRQSGASPLHLAGVGAGPPRDGPHDAAEARRRRHHDLVPQAAPDGEGGRRGRVGGLSLGGRRGCGRQRAGVRRRVG
mmetsp:Transcript_93150/g.268043  ORF Transcript_93150/g.268043 Transcript_93150/m.268043 type:complete len:329 (+) Transcript_93150:1467-2453(+)